MHHARLLVLASILFVIACEVPPTLPGAPADAATWVDVVLPEASVPPGYVLAELTLDGTTLTINPSAPCPTVEAGSADAPVPIDANPPSMITAGPDATAALDARALAADAFVDAVVEAAPVDVGPPTPADACTTPIAVGDLLFDEVMISTETGSLDRGQWVEVHSTRSCSLDLLGLHASAPHGRSFRTVDVTATTWLPALGFFLIADTTDATENNNLPGLVLAWAGTPADALHKTSDVITLSLGDVTLDTLTYPSKKRPEGVSYAFPAGCDPTLRADFANWRPSTASWFTGLFGTPNAANTDVSCATASITPTCTRAHAVPHREPLAL